jgi:hypothetical protein
MTSLTCIKNPPKDQLKYFLLAKDLKTLGKYTHACRYNFEELFSGKLSGKQSQQIF